MPSAPVVGGISFRDAMNTKRLSFWEIWNMSFGFLGIQFGFALQGGNMSRIFQTLGASKDCLLYTSPSPRD